VVRTTRNFGLRLNMRVKPSAGFSCAWPSELHE
jgi:hypothetical protein